MNKKNIVPQAIKPVVRLTQGTQTDLLAELSEEVLSGTEGCTPHAAGCFVCFCFCSTDDNAE